MKQTILKYSKFIIDLLFVVVLASLIITFVGQIVKVDGESMESTLHHNDLLYLNKLAYLNNGPERFDIVVFPYEKDEKVNYFIKRVVGLPGETLQINENGNILIDNKILDDRYEKEAAKYSGIAQNGIILKEDEYFLVGDNRNNSFDSRYLEIGPVKKSKILGKVDFR